MVTETFAEALARVNRANCDRIPTPQMAILRRAVSYLRQSGILKRCLQTGETSPDFHFIDSHDNQTSLYELLSSGPVVINFFRGFWCGYCEQELKAYEQILGRISACGAHYLAVSPCQDVPSELSERRYQLICDCDNQISKSFGIVYELSTQEKNLFTEWNLKLNEVNQSDKWELPLPATYVIGVDRAICFQYVDADFRARLDPEQIIDVLKGQMSVPTTRR